MGSVSTVSAEDRDARRLALFDQLLALVPAGRCIDLGAGHGRFAARAAAAGWEVVAVDARTDRFPALPDVEFVQADVRDVDLAEFDLVLCLGLWYHLTLVDQQALLTRAGGVPLLIDTHLATGVHDDPSVLSDSVSVEGYEGVWYREGPVEDLLASWGNERSFWHTQPSLLRLLERHGYAVVLLAEPWVSPDRRFLLALPTGWVPSTASVRGELAHLWRTVGHRVRRTVQRRRRRRRASPTMAR
jgi:SAM-dependent methyltransferase